MKINLPYSTLESSKNLKHNDRAYANCLALYAVDWYLKCLQFSTKPVQQDDWLLKYISESATLEVVGVGLLECIPAIGDTVTAQMPIDSQSNRVGYLFVRLNDELTSAEIIGFTPNYAEEVRLDRLQSTDDLIDRLCELESPSEPIAVVKLQTWFAGIFDSIWQEIAVLSMTPAFRSQPSLLSIKSIERSRRIAIGDLDNSSSIFLTVGIQQVSAIDFDLYLQIYPELPQTVLPIGLKFSAIDDRGNEIGSVRTKEGDISGEIVLESGKAGEKFSISIEFDGVKKTESFEI